MTLQSANQAALFVISPDGHTDEAGLQAAFKLLRAEAPVYWIEPAGVRPFWLISRHADVTAVERRGAPFIAAPRSVMSSEAGAASMRQISGKPEVLRSLFQMDDPEHRIYREITLPWFTRTGVAGLETLVTECAQAAVAGIAGRDDVFDFAAEVGVRFPLRVMMYILGLPEADDPFILKLARGLTGAESGLVGGLLNGFGATALGVGQAVAVAVAGQQVDVVGQAIQKGSGEPLAAEDLSPLVEGQVAGDQGRTALVAL